MSLLSSLPVEILYYIIDVVSPDDIESFAASCKLVRRLSDAAIKQHRELQQNYGKLYFGDLNHTSGDVLLFLQEIIEDPRVAFYPTLLAIRDYVFPDDLDSNDSYYDEPDYELDLKVKSVIASNGNDIRRLISGCSLLSPTEGERWYQRISKGKREPVFALLLTLLPNLRFIHLEVETTELENEFTIVADRIVRSHLQNQNQNTLYLRKLFDVYQITCNEICEEDFPHDLDILMTFAALPSVQQIFGDYMTHAYGTPDACSVWPYGVGVSSVTELNLRHIKIDENILPNFLEAFHGLRKFTLSGARGQRYQPRKILAVLRKYASHSLVSLHLTGLWIGWDLRYGDPTLANDLSMFKKLQNLHTDFTLFLDPAYRGCKCFYNRPCQKGRICSLIQILPNSIENVTLEGSISDPLFSFLMLGLPSTKGQQLPNLQRLIIGSNLVKETAKINAFREVGVELGFSDVSKGELDFDFERLFGYMNVRFPQRGQHTSLPSWRIAEGGREGKCDGD